MTAQIAADLRAAADILRRDGWAQGWNQNPADGCRCISGALAFAASGGRLSQPGELDLDGEFDRWSAAADIFRRVVGDDSIVDWNDRPGRTPVDVIAALEAAATAAEVQP